MSVEVKPLTVSIDECLVRDGDVMVQGTKIIIPGCVMELPLSRSDAITHLSYVLSHTDLAVHSEHHA